MQKIFYLLHLLCLVFALQTTAAEPVVTASLLQNSASEAMLSNAVDDVLTADFGDASNSIDMLEIAEVDVDKILLPAFSYPVQRTSNHAPEHQLPDYYPLFAFWLDRPPQIH
ncbi:hypothetical protein [Methylophilus methylotrophus]|uniref:hypothetical protein n=1 Tax=Methylophilus methylotrophus TaxID=17 RepID=UPI00047716F9|nr:hypothetical protein [Methylophilus methylotrophus]